MQHNMTQNGLKLGQLILRDIEGIFIQRKKTLIKILIRFMHRKF